MYQFSQHNIISKIKDSEEYYIVNMLSGNADILDKETFEAFQNNSPKNIEELIDKGYFADPEEEKKLFRNKYLNFVDNRDEDEVQVFFVPWYSCNFACSYCYQDEYGNNSSGLNKDIIDAFFIALNQQLPNRKKYITLFGGEPLLPGDFQKQLISYFFDKVSENKLQVAIVTNGYSIKEYLPILQKASIREIQVTLDGTADTHNSRRFLKDKSPTFNKISEGISLLIDNNIPVNLRMVVDKSNIYNLPDLARHAIDNGWTKSASFKTQLGRNYELHHCQNQRQKLYTRIELYQDLYQIIKDNPHILEFHKPAFSISKFLFEKGELPEPLFDSCPACKTEWAYDFSGKIYPCTATVGKKGEEVGNYYPLLTLNNAISCEWEERDITAIEECKICNLQLACGGGCGSVAKNNTNSLYKPDCRPIKELLELGLGLYINKKEF